MNYKVMQRPMFKMGGKAASQGTGITSGLDEKVNMTNGRANYADGPTTYQEFLNRALGKIEKRDAAMSGMNNLINLQAAQAASNVLSQESSNNPLDIIVNLAKEGTSIALPALSAKKKMKSDYAIAVTGNAGPTTDNTDASVGLVFIAIASDQGIRVEEFNFGQPREKVINRTVNKSLELLAQEIKK